MASAKPAARKKSTATSRAVTRQLAAVTIDPPIELPNPPQAPVKKSQSSAKSSTQSIEAGKQTIMHGTKRKLTDRDQPAASTRASKAAKLATTPIKNQRQDCVICCENKPLNNNERGSFPKVPSACEHDREVCKDCYRKHFEVTLENNLEAGWEGDLSCPSCGEAVTAKEAKAMVTKTFLLNINKKITNAQTKAHPKFLWCVKPRCNHGEIHEKASKKNPEVSCSKCRTAMCFNHQRKWHEGWTCDEFDATSDTAAALKKNEEELARITKPCPRCNTRIMKKGGCNHMMCSRCNKQWLWDEVTFDGEKIPTSAEIRGGPLGAPGLGPVQRALVHQVMEAEDAEFARLPPPPPTTVNIANVFNPAAVTGALVWARNAATATVDWVRARDEPLPVEATSDVTDSDEEVNDHEGDLVSETGESDEGDVATDDAREPRSVSVSSASDSDGNAPLVQVAARRNPRAVSGARRRGGVIREEQREVMAERVEIDLTNEAGNGEMVVNVTPSMALRTVLTMED